MSNEVIRDNTIDNPREEQSECDEYGNEMTAIHSTRVGKSMAISLFLALPEIRAVDAMPCL